MRKEANLIGEWMDNNTRNEWADKSEIMDPTKMERLGRTTGTSCPLIDNVQTFTSIYDIF